MDIKSIKDYSEKGKIKRTVTISNVGKTIVTKTVEDIKTKKEVSKIVDVYKMNRKEQELLLKKNGIKFDKKDNEASLVKKILEMKK